MERIKANCQFAPPFFEGSNMSRKFGNHKLSFKLGREIGRRLAACLAFGFLLVAGNPWDYASALAQDQDGAAAQKKFDEGEALRNQGTKESLRLAVKKYEEALLLWRSAGDRNGEAETLFNMGQTYHSLGENQKSLDINNQALAVFRETGDRDNEATTLNLIGSIYYALGDRRMALDSYAQSLAIYRTAGDRKGEANALNNIGRIYNSLGENQKALDSFTQALSLLRAVGMLDTEAITLRNIGSVYEAMGEKQKAQDFYAQAEAALSHSRRK
jgi:tetratricopeptide (TPR) repeat protein